MKKGRNTWQLDETSRHFITVILEDKKQEIVEFRRRWKLGDNGLPDKKSFPDWKDKVERECRGLRREIRVSEVEAYLDTSDALLDQPVLSSQAEGRFREENWGDSLTAAFALEIRALGRRLKFPQEWDRILEYYVLYNQKGFELIFNQGLTTSIRYRLNEEFGLLSENICLTLGENTASSDLENLWSQQIKPLLANLLVRIRDKKRKGKNALILEEMTRMKSEDAELKKQSKDLQISNEYKERDRDIALATMTDEETDRLYGHNSLRKENQVNKKLGKKVQNMKYYRSKRHPL